VFIVEDSENECASETSKLKIINFNDLINNETYLINSGEETVNQGIGVAVHGRG
jgi:hypothetical protein